MSSQAFNLSDRISIAATYRFFDFFDALRPTCDDQQTPSGPDLRRGGGIRPWLWPRGFGGAVTARVVTARVVTARVVTARAVGTEWRGPGVMPHREPTGGLRQRLSNPLGHLGGGASTLSRR